MASEDHKLWDVVIIGGGPAGLAAGIHLARGGYRSLLLERLRLGGQARLLGLVENYPGFPRGIQGKDLMDRWVRQGRYWGLKIRREEVREIARHGEGFSLRLLKNARLRAKSVVFCPGAAFKKLAIPGEKRFWGRGIYHAAFDKARGLAGKTVAVVGGGEAAVHQAILLSSHAGEVYLISREDRLKAHRLLLKRFNRRANIIWLGGTVVERARGGKFLERIYLRHSAGGIRSFLEISALFVLIGKERTQWLGLRGPKPCGFFVAGDAAGDVFRQVAVASGDGIRAAMRCMGFLERRSLA